MSKKDEELDSTEPEVDETEDSAEESKVQKKKNKVAKVKKKSSKEKKSTTKAKKVAKEKKSPKKERKSKQTAPFSETSIVGRAWALALKGTSIKELSKFSKKEGCNPAWLLRKLRRGKTDYNVHAWKWKVKEDDGKVKIYDAKVA
jgi:hypothetical protein